MTDALGTVLTLVALPIWGALLAAVMGQGRLRRFSALALAAAGLVAPFYAPTQVILVKGAAANLLAVGLLMTIDLARSPRDWSVRQRLLRVVAFVDPRTAKEARPSLGGHLIARLIFFFVTSIAFLWIAAQIGPSPPSAGELLLRWAAGVVFAYCGFEVMQCSVRIPLAWLGVDAAPFHRDPILARSIAEFWGERWNRIISGWLRRHCFLPFVKLGHPVLGVVTAFVVSALLHFYIMWPALGPLWALSFGGFFLIQPVLLVVERGLQIRRRPAWVGRVWTAGALLLTSPLFLEPGVRAFEPLLR